MYLQNLVKTDPQGHQDLVLQIQDSQYQRNVH